MSQETLVQFLGREGKFSWRRDRLPTPVFLGFPWGSAGKESAWNMEDLGLIPGLGRAPGEGKGYPLQDSGLENPMDCIVHGVAKSRTRLSDFHFQSGIRLKTGQGSGITVSKPRDRQPAHQPVPHQTPCSSLTLAEMSLDQVRLAVILFPALSPIPHVSLFNLSFWFYLLNIISTVKPRFKLRPQDCSASGLSTPRADLRSPHKKHQRPLVAFKRPSHVTVHEFRQTQILLRNPQPSRFLCEVLRVAITSLKITSFLF